MTEAKKPAAKKTGRAPRGSGSTVVVPLDDETRQRVDAILRQVDLTRPQFMRRALKSYLEKMEEHVSGTQPTFL